MGREITIGIEVGQERFIKEKIVSLGKVCLYLLT
jgi:hypothetical protein